MSTPVLRRALVALAAAALVLTLAATASAARYTVVFMQGRTIAGVRAVSQARVAGSADAPTRVARPSLLETLVTGGSSRCCSMRWSAAASKVGAPVLPTIAGRSGNRVR